MASAGSLAELSSSYGIDEAFSKVHTGVIEAVGYPEMRRPSITMIDSGPFDGMLAMNVIFS